MSFLRKRESINAAAFLDPCFRRGDKRTDIRLSSRQSLSEPCRTKTGIMFGSGRKG
jgi:hypothetical protein